MRFPPSPLATSSNQRPKNENHAIDSPNSQIIVQIEISLQKLASNRWPHFSSRHRLYVIQSILQLTLMMICMNTLFLSKKMNDKWSETNTKQTNHIIQQQQQFSFSVVSLFSAGNNTSVISFFALDCPWDRSFCAGSWEGFCVDSLGFWTRFLCADPSFTSSVRTHCFCSVSPVGGWWSL